MLEPGVAVAAGEAMGLSKLVVLVFFTLVFFSDGVFFFPTDDTVGRRERSDEGRRQSKPLYFIFQVYLVATTNRRNQMNPTTTTLRARD